MVAETKMNSANLALVFGPTLTRAPDSADPRQLHNDVPAINVLIQLCIEKYEYLFGPDTEEEGLSSPPPPPEAPIELDIVLSPPPVTEPTNEITGSHRVDTPDSFIDTPPPPEYIQEQYQYPPDVDEGIEVPLEPPEIPSREDKPVYIPEDTPPVDTHPEYTPPETQQIPLPVVQDESVIEPHPPTNDSRPLIDEPHPPINEPHSSVEEPVIQISEDQPVPPEQSKDTPPPPTSINQQVSTSSISTFLDQAFEDISAQIDSMKKDKIEETSSEEQLPLEQPPPDEKISKRRDSKKLLDDDDDEGDSDSDSEG